MTALALSSRQNIRALVLAATVPSVHGGTA